MKKIVIIIMLSVSLFNIGYGAEETFTDPTFLDVTGGVSSTCLADDPLGFDEVDNISQQGYMPFHFCQSRGFTGFTSYEVDSAGSDPDVCETNSSQTTLPVVYQFDTTGVNVYTSITCFSPDVKDGCTFPNALNYDPLATDNDGSCFYIDVSTEVEIFNNTSGGAENVLSSEFLEEYYDIRNTGFIIFAIICFIIAVIPSRRNYGY